MFIIHLTNGLRLRRQLDGRRWTCRGSLCLLSSSENWLRDSLSTKQMAQTEAAHWSFEFCASKGMFHRAFFSLNSYMQVRVCLSPSGHQKQKKKKKQEVIFFFIYQIPQEQNSKKNCGN